MGSLQGRAWGAGAVAGGQESWLCPLAFPASPRGCLAGETHSPESGALISVGCPLLSLGVRWCQGRTCSSQHGHPSAAFPVKPSSWSRLPSVRPSVHPPPCIEPLLGTGPCRRAGPPRLPAASPTRPLTGGLPASCPLPLPCPPVRRLIWFAAPHSVLTLGCWTQGRALLCSATAPPPNAPLPDAPWSSFQNLLSWFPASLWASLGSACPWALSQGRTPPHLSRPGFPAAPASGQQGFGET